ncbi:Hypothetical protein PAU_00102 [Photorhabdus asymbiotica]|uniref:Uncharacterized protein n=1 Tax=Photorhabdus asymbiotica subsp. asymbiotica (strain ATCC 43949 / 3105-77) TaxID=553480 RepID=C7BU45_PHOAA|nr:Hypothetical protein PAU_00102 [Photorhabdus asymbiotica]
MLRGIRSLAVAMHLEIYWVYINTDLLYGLKNRGIKMMSIEEIIIEIVSDISTAYGYMRSN